MNIKALILNSKIDLNSYYGRIDSIFPNIKCKSQNIQCDYGVLPGIFPLKNMGSHQDQNGTMTAWYNPDVMKAVRNMIKPGQYHAVIFGFDAAFYQPQIGETGGVTDTEQVYLGTQLATIRLDGNELTYGIHEMEHIFTHDLAFQGIDVVDNMDMTNVPQQNGTIRQIPYYLNDQPYSQQSNYSLTWKNIAPYQDRLGAPVPLLRAGQKSRYVGQLQTQLLALGYTIPITGYFGSMTLSAVKDVQQKNGLKVDGIVGPATAYYLVAH